MQRSTEFSNWISSSNDLVYCISSKSEITDFVWAGSLHDDREISFRWVRGTKMVTTEGLWDEVSAAFQFPYYFGENWAAYEECLMDLDWIDAHGYVMVLFDFSEVLKLDAVRDHALDVFVKGLARLAGERRSEGDGRFFKIIFQCSDVGPDQGLVARLGGSLTQLVLSRPFET